MTTTAARDRRPAHPAPTAAERARTLRRQRIAWLLGLLAVVVAVTYGLVTSREQTSSDARTAPDFTLQTTAGETVRLSDLRGEPVVLYFNEGAGCASCIVQMGEIEKHPAFGPGGLRVLPIVMNSAEQISADMTRHGVSTPFLLDDGTVSAAYGTLGTGMHEGLPGHGFVLVDAEGVQRWYGNYPSMWLDPEQLLAEVRAHLT